MGRLPDRTAGKLGRHVFTVKQLSLSYHLINLTCDISCKFVCHKEDWYLTDFFLLLVQTVFICKLNQFTIANIDGKITAIPLRMK